MPVELAGVVRRANQLVARLETAFARERRMSANLAHELRTPIAELRAIANVGERWPEDRDSTRQFFVDVREISQQMEALVASLLDLARLEAGIQELRSERFSQVAPGSEPGARPRSSGHRAPRRAFLEKERVAVRS